MYFLKKTKVFLHLNKVGQGHVTQQQQSVNTWELVLLDF